MSSSNTKTRVEDGYYTVNYNARSHFGTITQRFGSVWPQVLPYCIVNCCIYIALELFQRYSVYGDDSNNLSKIIGKGHSMMNVFISFLIVQRARMSLSRFDKTREYLYTMNRMARELVINTCLASKSEAPVLKDKQWRNDVAYYTCLLLRTVMAVIDYKVTNIPSWEIIQLRNNNEDAPKQHIMKYINNRRWLHVDTRCEEEQSQHVPYIMSNLLRQKIREGISASFPGWGISKMFGSAEGFVTAYDGLLQLLKTPFPFPLVQMARTFLFLYVYTISFSLLLSQKKATSIDYYYYMAIASNVVIIFVITYGFIGLETISMQFDNPFGNDANDFQNLQLAYTAFEDIYFTIYDIDGEEWADKLRLKMKTEVDNNNDVNNMPPERKWLLSEKSKSS